MPAIVLQDDFLLAFVRTYTLTWGRWAKLLRLVPWSTPMRLRIRWPAKFWANTLYENRRIAYRPRRALLADGLKGGLVMGQADEAQNASTLRWSTWVMAAAAAAISACAGSPTPAGRPGVRGPRPCDGCV